MTALAGSLLFIAWAAAVAVCDLRSRRIANSLVLAGLVGAFACAFAGGYPFGVAPAGAALGAVVGLLALLPFFMLRVMGAADVKVFAVLGAWCGVHALPGLWLAASLLAGLHAALLLAATRTRIATIVRRGGPTFEWQGHRATPYATCLTLSALACLAMHVMEGAAR